MSDADAILSYVQQHGYRSDNTWFDFENMNADEKEDLA